jgi:adenylate kinase
MKIICVTGTPGVGKTIFAKRLAKKKKLRYVPLNDILCKEGLCTSYHRSLKSYEIDVKKLRSFLRDFLHAMKKLGEGVVIDSHLSHEAPPSLVDGCYVLKCDINKLKRRLQKRGYSQRKIRENLDAEILDMCLIEAIDRGHHVKVVHR